MHCSYSGRTWNTFVNFIKSSNITEEKKRNVKRGGLRGQRDKRKLKIRKVVDSVFSYERKNKHFYGNLHAK